jgi:predicted P-loop ATPase
MSDTISLESLGLKDLSKVIDEKAKQRRAKKPPSMKSLGLRTKKQRVGDRLIDVAPASIYNAAKILQYHPAYEGKIRRDSFAMMNTIDGKPIQDSDLLAFCYNAEDWYGISFTTKTAYEAFAFVANNNEFDPLRDIITAKPWNARREKTKGMIDTWLIDIFGVEDTVLNRTIARKFLIGAVGRALYSTVERPIKMDNCLILYGEQGRRKSSGIEALAIDRRWFSDVPFDMTGKEFIQKITGKFLYELKELARRTKDKAAEKAFLDTQVDRLRLPYEKCVTARARRTSFIGTTNRLDLLSDSTGSRRFWVLRTCVDWAPDRVIDCEKLADLALDLWREAHHEFIEGVKAKTPFLWWLSPEEEKTRIEAVELFNSVHPWTNEIRDIVANLENREYSYYPFEDPKNDFATKREYQIVRFDDGKPQITPTIIMGIMDFAKKDKTPKNRTIIEMILRENDYVRKRRRYDGKRIINYEKETKKND